MFAMAITAGCSQLTNNQAKEENLSEIATDNTTDIAIDNTTDNSTSGIHEYKELLSVPYGEDGLVFAENEHSACAKSGSEELLKNISDGSFSSEDKLASIRYVLSMPTYNSIYKDDFRNAVEWLYRRLVEIPNK
jgi:hypothetical protein